MKRTWTAADFDQMSWHDNAVHGLRIIEGEYGLGEIVFDIDYILEWLPGPDENAACQFLIAPAELTFREASSLKVVLDYAVSSAALTPFAIDKIRIEPVTYLGGARGKRWIVEINWPKGEVSFEAAGFTQVLTGNATVSEGQKLSAQQRQQLQRA